MNETPQHIGDWLPGDNIPETLVPILQWQCQDQLHHIDQVMNKTADWINKHTEADTLPCFIGKVDHRINGEGKRLCTPYSQWMYERVLEPIVKADAKQRAEFTHWLNQQAMPFKPVQPNHSLLFQRSRLWRRDRLEQH